MFIINLSMFWLFILFQILLCFLPYVLRDLSVLALGLGFIRVLALGIH